MTTIGKDFPVRSDALRFSSETRASSAATSPARTECFDIFSAEPGDSDVINQMERLSSKEMKIAARLVWMAVGASCRSATGESVFTTSLCQSAGRYPPPHGICRTGLRLIAPNDFFAGCGDAGRWVGCRRRLKEAGF